ncbi:MAG: LysE family translocator [Proteobacteria bacterium]|nr:LysE family translocator [Pseudomonadota bacterium]
MTAAAPDLWLFFLLVAGVIALPGMDMAFVGGSTLAAGLRGGLVAVAGIVTGGGIHVLVGATGIAALMLWHPTAYNLLLAAGAVYMAWIGASLWRASGTAGGEAESDAAPAADTLPTIFGRAVLTCLLNPKAYAFMLAVLPAFLRTPEHTIAVQALRLSAIIAATQAVVYGGVALSVVHARRRTGASARGQRWAMRGVGATLLGGALLTLLLAWR